MLLTGIPNQCVQKQLDDLCVATPPHQQELMKTFVKTHRAICQRVGVKLAPETDKDKALLLRNERDCTWSNIRHQKLVLEFGQ